MSVDALTVERRQRVLVLHLDDGKANALSPALMRELIAQIGAAETDDEIGAVVIHGREGRFCGGFDLSIITGSDMDATIDLVATGGELVRTCYGASVPVVAACTGSAVAAGALLLLGCDVRIGADVPAKIGLNEVAIRMVLPDWAFTIATERLSRRHLQRAVANARLTSSDDAADAGFLDEVVPADRVLDRAVEVAADLAATLDPHAYGRTVAKLRGSTLAAMDAQIAHDRAATS